VKEDKRPQMKGKGQKGLEGGSRRPKAAETYVMLTNAQGEKGGGRKRKKGGKKPEKRLERQWVKWYVPWKSVKANRTSEGEPNPWIWRYGNQREQGGSGSYTQVTAAVKGKGVKLSAKNSSGIGHYQKKKPRWGGRWGEGFLERY